VRAGEARLSIQHLQFGRRQSVRRLVRGRIAGARPSGAARLTLFPIAVLLLLPALTALAQDVTESALKAAYVYNFATFTRWPDDAAPGAGPFVMCVLGDTAVGDALERTVKGRQHAGRALAVSRVTAAGPLRGCHILYLADVPAAQAAQIVKDIRDAPVLTISDMEGFGDLGGIAQFFFERGSLQFNVRVEPAKRARLEISSRLLILSKRP
jgi:hypothetical protein